MSKLVIWQKEEMISKIDWCQHIYRKRQNYERKYLFPIEDILAEFYKTAICGPDFYSIENLNILYDAYCNKNTDFYKSLEDIISQGWISVILGRWESALHNEQEYEQEDLSQYPDGEILKFLVWIKKQEKNKKPSVEVINPEAVLEKWRILYPSVPNLSWFEDQHFLCHIKGKHYAINGYSYRIEINQALAKLWMLSENQDFKRWIDIARHVNGTYHILDFLDFTSRQEILKHLLKDCIFPYDIPSWGLYNEHYRIKRILEIKRYALTSEKNFDMKFWTGNRVLDVNYYYRYGFEYERWYGVHLYDYHLVLFSVVVYLDELSEEDISNVIPYINTYDWIGSLYGLTEIGAENIFQLLTHGESMFLGFRYLLTGEGKNKKDMVIDVFKSIMLYASKQKDFFRGEEVGACLLYLMKSTKENFLLLNEFVELFSGKACLQQCANELYTYFEGLLQLKYDVDWAKGYHLLLFCIDKWFYASEEQQRLGIYKRMLDLSWKGYIMIYSEKAECAAFLDEEYFTENICFDWYQTYIEHQTISQKRRCLLPAIKDEVSNTSGKSQYKYKLLLTILYRIYEKTKFSEIFVKECIVEALEQVLTGENKVFDYSRIQIYSAEDVLRKNIATLALKDNTDKGLMCEMLLSPVPDLILYYHMTTDEGFKERIGITIGEQVTKESLCVYDNTHALDLVMEEQIEILYPFVEEMLERKLEAWKACGLWETEAYVEYAQHQKVRLQYVQGKYDEILSGDNQFFKAIVYMEVDLYLDYEKSDIIWKRMISERENKDCASSVFLNYMILLNRRLKKQDMLESEEKKYITQQMEWLMCIIEQGGLDKWNEEEKKEYCYLVVENKKLQGKFFWKELSHYNEKLQLNFSLEEFLKVSESEKIVNVQYENFIDDEAQGVVIEILNKLSDFQMRIMDFQKRDEVEITADLQDAVSGSLNTKYRIHLAREFTMGRALKRLGETDLYFYREEKGIKENIAVLENKNIENFKKQYMQLMGYLNHNFKFGITLSINRNKTLKDAEAYIINCLKEVKGDFSVNSVNLKEKNGFSYLVSEHIVPEVGKKMNVYHLIFHLFDMERTKVAKEAREK